MVEPLSDKMKRCPVQNTEISKDLRKGHLEKRTRHLSTLRSTLKNTILPVTVAHSGLRGQR